MLKKLLLLRHAKSSWKDCSLPDHDRPLKKRGREDAPKVGAVLAARGLAPDCVISSTATRAVETAQAVIDTCGYPGMLETNRRLYLAPPAVYFEVLRGLPESVERPLLVGHNPGIEELVAQLSIRPVRMSTAALAVIELPVHHWNELTLPCAGELLLFCRRKKLTTAVK